MVEQEFTLTGNLEISLGEITAVFGPQSGIQEKTATSNL